MAQFTSDLLTCVVDDKRDRLVEPLTYLSDLPEVRSVTVPAGFVTDYSSVPRAPFVYWIFGGRARKAAVLHDYAYATGRWSRRIADALYFEASQIQGVGWRAWPMWAGLRLGGWVAWQGDRPSSPPS